MMIYNMKNTRKFRENSLRLWGGRLQRHEKWRENWGDPLTSAGVQKPSSTTRPLYSHAIPNFSPASTPTPKSRQKPEVQISNQEDPLLSEERPTVRKNVSEKKKPSIGPVLGSKGPPVPKLVDYDVDDSYQKSDKATTETVPKRPFWAVPTKMDGTSKVSNCQIWHVSDLVLNPQKQKENKKADLKKLESDVFDFLG